MATSNGTATPPKQRVSGGGPTSPGVYKKPTTKDFDHFRHLCTDETGWERKYYNEQTGLVVWVKEMPGSEFLAVRARVTWNDVDADTVYDTLHDHEYRQEWDDHMVEGYTIETLTKNCEIGYYSIKLPLTISNRDFVNCRCWKRFPETGEYMIYNFSVLHKDMPEKRNFVRGSSMMTGYYVRKIGPTKTEFTYFSHTDPKGMIPAMLQNALVSKFGPRVLQQFYDCALKYNHWKVNHNPDKRPWLEEDKLEDEQ